MSKNLSALMRNKRAAIRLSGLFGLLLFLVLCFSPPTMSYLAPQAWPKVWDEAALKDWTTPLAGLNAQPGHITAAEYYAAPVETLRTYPVYHPDREPAGYWEKLQKTAPQPLLDGRARKNTADWIEAGRRVFVELDSLINRSLDAKLIAAARTKETFANIEPLPDGTIQGLRWTPTKQGVALSVSNCATCHVRYLSDGTAIPGAPTNRRLVLIPQLSAASATANGSPYPMPQETFGNRLFYAYAAPWANAAEAERLKHMTPTEFAPHNTAIVRGGGFLRWNGSPFHPAKVPDLIGMRERKYFDHTATEQQRGIGDLMRYAATVSYAAKAVFGSHNMLPDGVRKIWARASDEELYALAQYIYSLKPPPNPNPFNQQAQAGQKIFAREGCIGCHTPPLYTNNKVTLATGFTPPKDAPKWLDVLPLSVGTDAGLALETRKGTGYYKVPALKGVWYRGHYLHDGSVASLEEMFDPNRLKATHKPGGWNPPGVTTRAIKGHEFGLRLSVEDRASLIAFLRTL